MKSVLNLCVYSLMLAVLWMAMPAVNAQDTIQHIVPGRNNSVAQQKKPYVILISADGFRYDLAMRYKAKNLLRLSHAGVEATSMKPSFPTLTFPNHYSIITGMYPSHHGIVDNRFYDPKKDKVYAINKKTEVRDGSWYGGTPLWVLAEQQKMLSSSFYWVGSESDIKRVRPTYYFNYNEDIPIDRRLQILKDWLQLPDEKRPHLITFYFPEVDHAAHSHGVYSKETEATVQFVDDAVGKMNALALESKLPINFIFVSDHGFTNIDTVNTLRTPDIDTSKFTVSYGSNLVHLYAKNVKDILPAYQAIKKIQKNYKAYLAKDVPAKWHYGSLDDYYQRIGDIIIAADMPFIFYSRGRKNPGAHGYDNSAPEMQSTFYAWGPAFKENFKINNFENVNVFPLVAHILGLKYDEKTIGHKIDGDIKVLKGILKESE